MDEFPSVMVDGTEIVVDQDRPIAAVVSPDGTIGFATWADLDVGLVELEPVLLSAPDSAWVTYPPLTISLMDSSHDAVLVGRDSLAVQIRPDGSIAAVRSGDRLAVGATTGALWTAPYRQQHLDERYRGGPMPAGWEERTVLTLTRPGGPSSEMSVDRHVMAVFEADGLVHVVVAPTPPIARPDGRRGHSFEYRVSEITFSSTAPFPERLRFLDQHPDGLGPAVADRRHGWTAHSWDLPPTPSRAIDLSGVTGSRWARAVLTPAQITAATDAAGGWFGDPNEYWTASDGSAGPLASGMRDAEVHIEGEWPATRCVITFRHPHWAAGRLRRSVRVFDDAGRIAVDPDAGIRLKEDVETGDLPPADEGRNGYLEI